MAHRLLGFGKGLAVLLILMLPGLKPAQDHTEIPDRSYVSALTECLQGHDIFFTDGVTTIYKIPCSDRVIVRVPE